jgi:hypothetical protein
LFALRVNRDTSTCINVVIETIERLEKCANRKTGTAVKIVPRRNFGERGGYEALLLHQPHKAVDA